jgi:hypothetical protein
MLSKKKFAHSRDINSVAFSPDGKIGRAHV